MLKMTFFLLALHFISGLIYIEVFLDLLDILYKTLQNDVVLCLCSQYTKLTFQETNIPT